MSEAMEKLEPPVDARRRVLNIVVSTILIEAGFSSVDKIALETLTEILQCFYAELGRLSIGFCEIAGRTEPVIGDIICAFANMGLSMNSIEKFAHRSGRHLIPTPSAAQPPKPVALLGAGHKRRPPPHIPAFAPPLPDPHAYLRTPTHKQPVTEYEAIREKAASQKRDIEKALTKFLAKTGETHNMFNTDDNHVFPLIACKPTFPAYLSCLLPTDQLFDFEELEYHFQVANRTEDVPEKKGEQSDNEGESMDQDNSESKDKDDPGSPTNMDVDKK